MAAVFPAQVRLEHNYICVEPVYGFIAQIWIYGLYDAYLRFTDNKLQIDCTFQGRLQNTQLCVYNTWTGVDTRPINGSDIRNTEYNYLFQDLLLHLPTQFRAMLPE